MALMKGNPIKKQYLTVGEVSKMLGGTISKGTAARYVDRGILTGWKNPITGRRLIHRESVEALAKKGMKVWPRRGRPRKPWRPSSEAEVTLVTEKEG